MHTQSSALKMKRLAFAFALCLFVVDVYSTSSIDWCYHDPACDDRTWPVLFGDSCNGSRQSPINIATADTTENASLTGFTFTNFGNTGVLANITNTGRTVRVNFNRGVQISGGGLSEPYDSLQFHLHWGNRSTIGGSEHTVNGRRYPMELHIVNIKSRFNGNTSLALEDPTGAAALGFFIEADSSVNTSQPWRDLVAYLSQIPLAGDLVNITNDIPLDGLLEGVNFTRYYRYLGSLTTPTCREIVVWTVFKDTIRVSPELIDLFSTELRIDNTTDSPLMVNVFRNILPALPVTTQPVREETGDSVKSCASLALLALSLVLSSS
ncbi:carbonic anhydrase 4-like [Nerophis lumbriciformis]|uniref:carbonic anhydrase 4-like n=1 Tax=Nerophis lumbriciformis TaxID=546530 RepID=UPI002AE07BC4|nr:carbonic anhydrase 4-like [Nerophis lumbriciformis]